MGGSTIKRLNFDKIIIPEPKIKKTDFKLSRNESNLLSKANDVKIYKAEAPRGQNFDIFPQESPLGHRNGMTYETE